MFVFTIAIIFWIIPAILNVFLIRKILKLGSYSLCSFGEALGLVILSFIPIGAVMVFGMNLILLTDEIDMDGEEFLQKVFHIKEEE